MWGWDGSAGQTWSWRLLPPAMSILVKWPSGWRQGSVNGVFRSSSGIQVTLPESHSEEAMVRSGTASVPHSGQGRSTGSVTTQWIQPPVFQPGAWQRLFRYSSCGSSAYELYSAGSTVSQRLVSSS